MTKATSAYLNKPLRELKDVGDKQMTHTPGPWYVKTVPTSIGHCHKIQPVNACLYVDYRGIRAADPKTAIAEANARLIAAAPDLLESLEDSVLCIDAARQTIFKADGIIDHRTISAHLEKARAAIDKATGE